MLLKSTKISSIGPEANAPTDTERTALTVPVELTTDSTRPQLTAAVRNFGGCLRNLPKNGLAAPPTTATRMPAINVHFKNRRIKSPFRPFSSRVWKYYRMRQKTTN